MNKQNSRRLLRSILLAILFAMAAAIFLMASPMNPIRQSLPATDSSVFQTIAMMMEKGYMPYRDTFDHKGPLIYVLNYLGRRISHIYGIWLIEWVSLFVVLVFIYKIARLQCSWVQSCVVVFISMIPLFSYFEYGNFTEEYAMPFIAISLYIFLDYLLFDSVTSLRIFVCGICMGGVLMLRPNMISTWVVFCIAIFISCLYHKQYKKLGKFILYFILGAVIFITTFLIWLGANHVLKDFFSDYIQFNLQYSGDTQLYQRWGAVWTFVDNAVLLLSIVATMFFIYKRKMTVENTLYFFYLGITILLTCMSGRTYAHYAMILIPTFAFPLSQIFSYCNELHQQTLAFFFSAFFFCNMIASPWISIIAEIPHMYSNRDFTIIDADTLDMCNTIREHTSEDDTISVYGNLDYIYLLTDRKHATKYSYQYPIGLISDEIDAEYWQQLEEEQPSVIVLAYAFNEERTNKMMEFLEKNSYSVLWRSEEEAYKMVAYAKN